MPAKPSKFPDTLQGNHHPEPPRKKTVRRDPDKRKQQNRQSQKTYREKQRRRIEELERCAAAATSSTRDPPSLETASPALDYAQAGPASFLGTPEVPLPAGHDELPTFPTEDIEARAQEPSVIDPALLQNPPVSILPFPASPPELITGQKLSPGLDLSFLSTEFDRWLHDTPYTLLPSSSSPSPPLPSSHPPQASLGVESCTCNGMHLSRPACIYWTYAPAVPSTPFIYSNNLRIDTWCILSALLENCLHLGVSRSMFCADDSESPFFHIRRNDAAIANNTESHPPPEASQRQVQHAKHTHGTIKYDLRPIDSQVLTSHHPYIDVLPFRDLRGNLISAQREIDEDEFLLDFLTNATCWGGVRESGSGSGCPWDGRSWEANENFLQKWWSVVGGEDGELTRASRWWKEMRGERVTEVF